MITAGLVLEGGGMRGVYTAGVLDRLMDEGLWFSDVYGVSAGACHGSSYVSRQRGRAIRTVLEYVGDSRYGGVGNLLRTGNYFGEQFVYEELPQRLIPFDYDGYTASGMRLYSVVYNCRTGETEYPPVVDMRQDMKWILASSSLPLLSKMVVIDGEPYLDGGISDSIPLARAMRDGHDRNLVVLTQHRGYQKQANKLGPLLAARYRAYPRLVEAMARRHRLYQAQLEHVYAEEARGAAVVIQPASPVTIGRMEKDVGALRALYDQGYQDARDAAGRLAQVFGTP